MVSISTCFLSFSSITHCFCRRRPRLSHPNVYYDGFYGDDEDFDDSVYGYDQNHNYGYQQNYSSSNAYGYDTTYATGAHQFNPNYLNQQNMAQWVMFVSVLLTIHFLHVFGMPKYKYKYI